MKKGFIIGLSMLLALGLCGCGEQQDASVQEAEKDIWLLEEQISYDGFDTLAMKSVNHYNEDGYVVYSESDFYEFGEYTDEINFTYEYSGEEGDDGGMVCIVTMDRGDAPYYEPWEAEPYETTLTHEDYPGWENIGNICTLTVMADELEDGKTLPNWNEDPAQEPQFDHAEYTFDENGLPITIVTYGRGGEIIGTTTNTWRLFEPVS